MIRREYAALDDGRFRRDLVETEDGWRLPDMAITDALIELNMRRTVARKIGRYMEGLNERITNRETQDDGAPDNRVAVPYARKLVNTVVGYMFRPSYTQYASDDDAYKEALDDAFWDNNEQSKTSKIGKLMSIFGVAYELHYTVQRNGAPAPRFAPVPTEDLLPVYSNDIEPEIVAAVRRYAVDMPGEYRSVERLEVYYDDVIHEFDVYQDESGLHVLPRIFTDADGSKQRSVIEHGYGMVPVSVYRNNDTIVGDFEHVIDLIDAYDVLLSDSLNEFDRFAWAYLVLRNISMSDENIDDAKRKRVLEVFGENGSIDFLTKQVQTEFIKYMREWIREEIHKQTHIPDMTDEHFAGNQSGIAIRYKLTDLENIASVKEVGFREGLRRRIDLLNAFWRTQGRPVRNVRDVDIIMQRNVPENFIEQAEIIGKLRGHISHKTLLDQVATFVDDASAEMDAIEQEQDVLFGGEEAGDDSADS